MMNSSGVSDQCPGIPRQTLEKVELSLIVPL